MDETHRRMTTLEERVEALEREVERLRDDPEPAATPPAPKSLRRDLEMRRSWEYLPFTIAIFILAFFAVRWVCDLLGI